MNRMRDSAHEENMLSAASAAASAAKRTEALMKQLVKNGAVITDDQIKQMVNRFLGWKLPEDFHPDAGISFNPFFNVEYNAKQGKPPNRHTPSGTNLFNATRAEAMVRYILNQGGE